MVEGYVGRPGSGKSYSMISRALREAKRKGHKAELFSNIPLVGVRYTLIESFDELDGCTSGTVLLDELGLWMSSRDSMKLPAGVRAFLAQHRKLGLDLYWTAQHENRVDTIIRELTSILWKCSKWPFGIVMRGIDPFDPEQKYGFKREKWSPEVFAAYDTAWMIGNPKSGEGGKLGALRQVQPPVALRGCERVEVAPGLVEYRRVNDRRGILIEA